MSSQLVWIFEAGAMVGLNALKTNIQVRKWSLQIMLEHLNMIFPGEIMAFVS